VRERVSQLRVPAGQLEPERDRLRVDAVASPDHDGFAMHFDLFPDGSAQSIERFEENA
jgi:hypothetical protein